MILANNLACGQVGAEFSGKVSKNRTALEEEREGVLTDNDPL